MSPSISPAALSAVRVLSVLSAITAAVQAAPPAQYADLASLEERAGAQTYSGCYSSSDPLTEFGTYTYQSTSWCGGDCTGKNAAVLGLTDGNACWCGNQLPALSSKVDDSNCNVNCTGYGQQMCGGANFWSVYLTGVDDSVGNIGGSSSSSSSGSSTTTTTSSSTTQSIVTSVAPGTTVVVTQPADHSSSSTPKPSSGSSGSNTGGIVAGVVVGIAGFAAIIGGVWYYLRYRQRKLAQEEYQRSTQVQDFMRQTGSSTTPAPRVSPFADPVGLDQRLDPLAGRRNSVGSLADAQDYSRRILRVANPDGH